MYLMVESGIRGGVSVVTHKHAKANNQYLESEYDSSKPISHCIYLDANNLYGWAMSQKMPYGDLRFLTSIEIEQLNIYELKDDADTGYIFEVDLDYPDHLHDLHNDLPVAPVQRKVLWNELSPYTKTLTSHLPWVGRRERRFGERDEKVLKNRRLSLGRFRGRIWISRPTKWPNRR